MEDSKKKDLRLDFDNYKHLKVFGISLLVISLILITLVSFIFLIRYSEVVRDFVVGKVEKETGRVTLTLTSEENAIIKVVEEASPSVVSIAVSQITLKSGEGLVDEVSNIGTGFVVDPNGIIITNQHVVSDTSALYKVITNEGVEYEVVEVLRDDINDIAIVKVDATDLVALELGDSDNLLVGQTVIAIGTPLGEYAGSVTTGVISGVNRSVATSSGWFDSTTKYMKM